MTRIDKLKVGDIFFCSEMCVAVILSIQTDNSDSIKLTYFTENCKMGQWITWKNHILLITEEYINGY